MNAICADSECYVRPRVDQDASFGRALTNALNGFARKLFQFGDREVLLAKLNQVYAGGSSFRYTMKEGPSPVGVASWKL